MKMPRLITPILILAASVSAQAAVQPVPFMNLPLSLPTRVAPEAVTLPSRIAPEAVGLPSTPMLPVGPTSLPSTPIPLPSIHPGVHLPGPKTVPMLPTKILLADSKENEKEPRKTDDELGRVFDGRVSRRPFQIHEDRYHTIPEQDLINEIGIGSY